MDSQEKTSKEWCNHFDCVVFDPDGWDRINYEKSFELELITKAEFKRRCSSSTMLMRGTLDLTL